MEYVVFDLEWNQASFCKASIRKKLDKFPFRLKGEIIQIGAVRVDTNQGIVGQFKISIRPQFFLIMDKKIMHLTGIDQAALAGGEDFPTAIRQFRAWCGAAAVFFTWGPDDGVILRQNLQLYDLDGEFLQHCFDLQKIFSLQVPEVTQKQVSLKKAVEYFAIDDEARAAHDALNDAYDAACIAGKLDLAKGIEACDKLRPKDVLEEAQIRQQLLFHRLASKEEAFQRMKLARNRCPECGRGMRSEKIIKWKRGQYIQLSHCERDGTFFVSIRFEKDYHFTWTIRKELYAAEPRLVALYRAEAEKHAKREAAARAAAQAANREKISQVL